MLHDHSHTRRVLGRAKPIGYPTYATCQVTRPCVRPCGA
ncbi:hypothetical protein F383_33804 [Gossypium arboreum]|uniref:Uncharacterized protein n=1 Tax=Gossypium arboreum TaxID=29729 RepID=A0A0B0MWU2_GOSAR|nr:hypothetical protein F383_33804 [Gossypium arboreum]